MTWTENSLTSSQCYRTMTVTVDSDGQSRSYHILERDLKQVYTELGILLRLTWSDEPSTSTPSSTSRLAANVLLPLETGHVTGLLITLTTGSDDKKG